MSFASCDCPFWLFSGSEYVLLSIVLDVPASLHPETVNSTGYRENEKKEKKNRVISSYYFNVTMSGISIRNSKEKRRIGTFKPMYDSSPNKFNNRLYFFTHVLCIRMPHSVQIKWITFQYKRFETVNIITLYYSA